MAKKRNPLFQFDVYDEDATGTNGIKDMHGLVIFHHRHTGISYVMVRRNYNNGGNYLMPMIGIDGKPLVYTPEDIRQASEQLDS